MKKVAYIQEHLIKNLHDIKVEYYKEIDSTNDYIANLDFVHKYHLCYADIQAKGKGRRGSQWLSEDKDNIYSTIGFNHSEPISEMALISIKVALAVFDAIKTFIPTELQENLKIKLPNDIYYEDKKLAGILIETKGITVKGFDIIVGVGVNVNMKATNSELDRAWESIANINKRAIDSSHLLVNIFTNVVNYIDYDKQEVLFNFSSNDYTLNKQISFYDSSNYHEGVCLGIDDELKLNVSIENQLYRFELANINTVRVVK